MMIVTMRTITTMIMMIYDDDDEDNNDDDYDEDNNNNDDDDDYEDVSEDVYDYDAYLIFVTTITTAGCVNKFSQA